MNKLEGYKGIWRRQLSRTRGPGAVQLRCGAVRPPRIYLIQISLNNHCQYVEHRKFHESLEVWPDQFLKEGNVPLFTKICRILLLYKLVESNVIFKGRMPSREETDYALETAKRLNVEKEVFETVEEIAKDLSAKASSLPWAKRPLSALSRLDGIDKRLEAIEYRLGRLEALESVRASAMTQCPPTPATAEEMENKYGV